MQIEEGRRRRKGIRKERVEAGEQEVAIKNAIMEKQRKRQVQRNGLKVRLVEGVSGHRGKGGEKCEAAG